MPNGGKVTQQIKSADMERAVNRIIEILEKDFSFQHVQIAFVLQTAKDHVEKFHGFKLERALLIANQPENGK